MSDTNKLMIDALTQHKTWLKEQMQDYLHSQEGGEWKIAFRVLIAQVDDIKLRMSRIDALDSASILWEYPDELLAFLRSERAPKHLRDTLEGGHLVEPTEPGHSVKRAR